MLTISLSFLVYFILLYAHAFYNFVLVGMQELYVVAKSHKSLVLYVVYFLKCCSHFAGNDTGRKLHDHVWYRQTPQKSLFNKENG